MTVNDEETETKNKNKTDGATLGGVLHTYQLVQAWRVENIAEK